MSDTRKLEIILDNGRIDILTKVSSIQKDGGWVYCYLPNDHKVTYRADKIISINSVPMPNE
jgi:hypothetical protein